MMLNPNEAGKFWNFLCFVDKNDKNNYKLVFKDGSVIYSKLDTMCESDNGLELENPNYEEYWIIVFENLKNHELFEVNYHNTPIEVWCDGKKVDLDNYPESNVQNA